MNIWVSFAFLVVMPVILCFRGSSPSELMSKTNGPLIGMCGFNLQPFFYYYLVGKKPVFFIKVSLYKEINI